MPYAKDADDVDADADDDDSSDEVGLYSGALLGSGCCKSACFEAGGH
jgi:hypothetical protein